MPGGRYYDRSPDFTSKMHISQSFHAPEGTTRRVNAERGAEMYQETSYNLSWRLRAYGQGVELALPYLPKTGMAVYLAQRFGEGTVPDDLARVIAPAYRGQSLVVEDGRERVGTTGYATGGREQLGGGGGAGASGVGDPREAALPMRGRRGAATATGGTSGVLAPVQGWPLCCVAGAVQCRNVHHLLREDQSVPRTSACLDCGLQPCDLTWHMLDDLIRFYTKFP
jgi:hypothetical protein